MGISSLYGFRHEGDVWPIEVIKGFSDWLLELFGLVLGSNEAGGWRLKAPGMPGGGGSCNIGGDVEFWLTLLVWAWAAWAAAANPWKRALRLSAKGEVAAPGPNLADAWAAMWAWRKGSGRGRGRRGSGLPSLAKRSAWAAAAAAACCCCCRNCMNWVRPFSNMLGVGLMVCGRAKCWPPRGGGGGEGGEYSLIAILTLFCLWSDTVNISSNHTRLKHSSKSQNITHCAVMNMAISNLIFDAKLETTKRDEVWVPTDLSNRKSLLQQGGEFLSLDFSLPAVHCCMYPTVHWAVRTADTPASDDENRTARRAFAGGAPLVSATFVISYGEAFSTAFCAAICRLTNFGVG